MSALKEFADFITLNMANLAATYAQLLAESNAGYENFPAESRVTSARKLLRVVIEAYESQTSNPLLRFFDTHTNDSSRRWAEYIDPPHPLAEIECLGQTLTPVVTNLESGKFLWRILSEVRATLSRSAESMTASPAIPPIHKEADETAMLHKEARQVQNLLPDSEVRFRKIFEYSNDAIFIVDPVQDKILDVNAKVCSLLGYSKDELLSMSFSNICPHEISKFMTFVQSVIDQGEGRTDELSCMTHSDRILPAEISATIIDTGDPPYLIALVRDVAERKQAEQKYIEDITERKQAEDALRESEERYRLLLDSSPDPIVTYDRTGHVLYVNPAFAQIFGWSKDELLGKQVDFVPEENWPETKAALEQLFSEEKVLGFETKRLTKDGRILDVQQSGAIFKDKDGNPAGSIIFIRDIAERKQSEDTAQQRARREQTIRQITEKMRTAATLDELVKTAAEELGERLSAGHTVVQLGREVNKNT